ncbi:ComC/BlpC family leader-containing pheromone/bacteriocin [Streptococcus dentasini]
MKTLAFEQFEAVDNETLATVEGGALRDWSYILYGPVGGYLVNEWASGELFNEWE